MKLSTRIAMNRLMKICVTITRYVRKKGKAKAELPHLFVNYDLFASTSARFSVSLHWNMMFFPRAKSYMTWLASPVAARSNRKKELKKSLKLE